MPRRGTDSDVGGDGEGDLGGKQGVPEEMRFKLELN